MSWVLCQTPVKYLNWDHPLEILPVSGGRRENLGLALK